MIVSKLQDPFEIIIGTYEQYVLGYKVTNIVNEYKMEKSFATHSHIASVRSVSSSKYYTASAGADETICLYDMRYRRECGKLVHHNDTINCIAYTPENSHLFTCSNDGSIAAIHCGNWQIERHWLKAHKGLAVNTLAIHPTGKLALSTGADGVLRTWNLIKGRQAYAVNLIPKLKLDAKYVTLVKWSPNGEKYLLGVNRKVYLYSVESAGIEKEIELNSKVICAEFLKDNLIAVGLENGQIKFCDLKAQIETIDTMAHSMRVKCMARMNNLLVSASSSGEIKLWKYNKHGLNMLQSVNCGARITCLSLAQICQNISENEVKSEDEEEVEEKNKIRVEQEVIVEYDDDEITNIEDSQIQTSKTKRKKKKAVIRDDSVEDGNVSRSKKKASLDVNVVHSKEKALEAKDLKKHKEEKTSKKRDRSSDIADEIAKCQKKKKISKVNETGISKKRKKIESALPAVLPTKKIRKINKIEESSVPSKKHKITSTDLEDALSKKMKKAANTEKAIPSKKKKRRITETD